MSDLQQPIEKLRKAGDLDATEAATAARALASPCVPANEKRAFLILLAQKGETPSEVAAFANEFRDMARDPSVGDLAAKAIDVGGTGGDGTGSFNITAVALTLAAGGIPVMKHGNRSITSKSGTADLLEALGINIELDDGQIRASLETLNFAFLFAPAFHPAFKEIMPVRAALAAEGKRSIFNILGPLINPARPAHQMVGVFSKHWVVPVAQALDTMGLKRGIVVHGFLPDGGGMDELNCTSENRVVGFGELRNTDQIWTPEMSGLARCQPEDLAGGKAEDNLRIFQDILDGRGKKGLVDTILFNAGAAFWVAGKADGVAVARELLLGGQVRDWLCSAREFYAD